MEAVPYLEAGVALVSLAIFFYGLKVAIDALRDLISELRVDLKKVAQMLVDKIKDDREHSNKEHAALMDTVNEVRKAMVEDHKDMLKLHSENARDIVKIRADLESHVGEQRAKK